MKFFGTEYGGWNIDQSKIYKGDTIIDAGIGEDISFTEELQKHFENSLNIIGIDPTKKAINYINNVKPKNYTLIPCAVCVSGIDHLTMYKNIIPSHVSESCEGTHRSVSRYQTYKADTISIAEIRSKTPNISLIKLDIEGAEYDMIHECLGIPQIAVEFHHFCIEEKSEEDTTNMVELICSLGYNIAYKDDKNTTFTFTTQ